MVKADLITGFLGSGKTTFIRKYVEYLLSLGEKICILENDYGAVNVDMMLLSDLKSERLGIEMVAGGCDYDCHKRRFKTKLITIAMLGYTRVIIEPSGIFDVDEFYDILHEDPLYEKYEINNVIAIVNAKDSSDYSNDSDYMLASEAATAGVVVLSHLEECKGENAASDTINHLNETLKNIKCNRFFDLSKNVTAKPFDLLDSSDFSFINASGHIETAFEKRVFMDENSYKSLFFMGLSVSVNELKEKAKLLFSDPSFGKIHRVKGFIKEEGKWFEFNAIKDKITVKPLTNGQDIIIVIGENLNEEKIDNIFPSEYSTKRFM